MADSFFDFLKLQIQYIGQHTTALESQATIIESQIASLEQLKQAGFPIGPLAEQLNDDLAEISKSAQSLQNTMTTVGGELEAIQDAVIEDKDAQTEELRSFIKRVIELESKMEEQEENIQQISQTH